jgi:hypothetical protein
MIILVISLSIIAAAAIVGFILLFHKNSVIELKHEYQLKELETLFNDQITKAQSVISEYETHISTYQNYFTNLNEVIHISNARLKQIDHKGSFQADDEVGFFFKNLLEIQATLNEFDFSKSIVKSGISSEKETVLGPDGKLIPKDHYIPFEKVQEVLATK